MKRDRSIVSTNQGLSAAELQSLVDELMKDRPDQGLVRSLMLKQGIAYTKDPIAQMGLVLKSMGQSSKTKDSVSL